MKKKKKKNDCSFNNHLKTLENLLERNERRNNSIIFKQILCDNLISCFKNISSKSMKKKNGFKEDLKRNYSAKEYFRTMEKKLREK